MSARTRPLTERRRRFVAEYLIDRNGTAAYRRAFPGAAYTTARTESSRLLANPNIRAEVDAARREHACRCRVSRDRIIRELAAVAFADIGDVIGDDWRPLPLTEIPPAARRTVARLSIRRAPDGSESVSVVLCSKLAALDKLCRHLGLYRELPPLEVLLNALPPGFAAEVRRALTATVVTGGECP
jgi:phage terminase small subunit